MAVEKINSFKTLNEIETYRREINEACDKRASFIKICNKANEISERDFGYIKESFETISPILFETNEGKQIINKYTKTVRENKNLSSLHKLYENIRKANIDSDVDFFINSIANADWGVSKKTVNEDVKKLGRILAEGYILISQNKTVNLPLVNNKLSNAVLYVAENKKTQKNIADYSNAVKIIRESIMKNEKTQNVFENVNLDELATTMLSEFNAKYSDSLTIEEANALKEISSSADRESVFNKYKELCSNKINEAKVTFEKNGDNAASERLSVVLEQISNKSFSLETVGSDICSLIELSNIFE